MTTPEQTNERPRPDGDAEPDVTDAGRPRIRPGPGEDPTPVADQSGGTSTSELNPDATDAGRPRIRPGPGEG